MTKLSKKLSISLALNVSVKVSVDPIPVIPLISDPLGELNYYSDRYLVGATIDSANKSGTVSIFYGRNGAYDNEIVCDPIAADSGTVARTASIPKIKPGLLTWKVVFHADGKNYEAIGEPYRVYPGTQNVNPRYSLPVMVGTTYYIDPSATVNGDGSESSPFNTLPVLGNSNTYLLKRGTTLTYTGYASRIGTIGTCTLGAYGPENIDDPIIHWAVSGTTSNRFIDATSNTGQPVIIKDIKLKSDDIYGTGIYLANNPGSWIYNCEIEGFGWPIYTETHVFSPYQLQWAGLKILYCTIHNHGIDGLNIRSVTDLEIGHTYIYDTNMYYWVNHPANIHEDDSPGDGIQINSGCRNPLDPTGERIPQNTHIHHCTVDRSSSGNKMCVIADSYTSNMILEYNHFIGQRSIIGNTVNGIYLSMGVQTNDNVVRNNLFEECATANAVYHNATFAYNKVINCNNGLVINASRVQRVYNNVFHNLTGLAVNKLSNASANVHNNLFIDCPNTIQFLSGGTNTNSHNHFDNSTSSGTDATTGDCLVVDKANRNYYPLVGSPLINSGIDVGLITDFVDETVPQGGGFDKGIFEFLTT